MIRSAISIGLLAIAALLPMHAGATEQSDSVRKHTPAVVSSEIGQSVTASDSSLTVTCIDRRGGRHSGEHYDADIQSPKSAVFSADGKKLYINSLEGGKTVVYDARTRRKLKVISHRFGKPSAPLWLPSSGYYTFTHYPDGATRPFMGKPVEEAMTPDGRWLIVPYYRRTFDINAQDPSALAVIDTRTDSIVVMAETGPLPKMVRTSSDGRLLAITHWGDNTVGFMDISDLDPHRWHHLPPITIGTKLNLNYSLTSPVNRDSNSGYLLRGTLFLPGDSLLLISGMAGPVAVIDVKSHQWIGMIPQLQSVRHIVRSGDMLYMSRNTAGEALSVPLDSVVSAIRSQRHGTRSFSIGGIRRAKIGSGARTLQPSPSGKYLFVACNSASALYIVRTSDMKVIAAIPVDSYPVGLDVSADGTLIAVTSQGRDHRGGNAVNFFRVDYADPEPCLLPLKADSTAADSLLSAAPQPAAAAAVNRMAVWPLIAAALLLMAAAAACALVIRRRPKRYSGRKDDGKGA